MTCGDAGRRAARLNLSWGGHRKKARVTHLILFVPLLLLPDWQARPPFYSFSLRQPLRLFVPASLPVGRILTAERASGVRTLPSVMLSMRRLAAPRQPLGAQPPHLKCVASTKLLAWSWRDVALPVCCHCICWCLKVNAIAAGMLLLPARAT